MKRRRGVTQRGRFACTHVSGDNAHGAQFKGVEESVREGMETRQGVEVFDFDVLREGFALEAEKVLRESHRRVSFRRVFHPGKALPWEG